MNQAITLVLSNLIPRHSGALPPELLSLTSSLIAQSRVKCTLNKEQEIGRTYACANLACERLKTTLNLPKIEPRPPVPPRVYKKLYAYIENSLAIATPRKRRRIEEDENESRNGSGSAAPSRKASAAQTPQKRTPGRDNTPLKPIHPLPQRSTPSKSRSLASFRMPKKGLRYEKRDEKKIPKWVGAVGRELCGKLGMKEATPHVLAGVESLIFREEEKARRGEEVIGSWPAMMTAVWIFVWKELKGKSEISPDDLAEMRISALNVLKEARRNKEVGRKVGGEGWQGWDLPEEEGKEEEEEEDEDEDEDEEESEEGEDIEKKARSNATDVNSWVAEIVGQCLEMDWYQNITRQDQSDDGDEIEDQEEEDARAQAREHEMRYGLGTMRQKKVDYLSDEKRAAYKVWEENMLAKITEQLREATKHVDVMEADV